MTASPTYLYRVSVGEIWRMGFQFIIFLFIAGFIFITTSTDPARGESGGVTKYLELLSEQHKRVRDDIFASSQIKTKTSTIDIKIFVGDIFDPLRLSDSSHIDGMILSTNIQMNFGSDSPNIMRSFRSVLPSSTREEIREDFKLLKFAQYGYGQGVAVPRHVALPSGNYRFCFVITDDERGLSWEGRFVERNLQIQNIADGSKQCFLALARTATSILMPTVGASQIRRGDPTSPLNASWQREKHICRIQKAIRGILKGLSESSDELTERSKIKEVGIVVYQQDVARAVPNTRNPSALEYALVRQAILYAFGKGAEEFSAPTQVPTPTRVNGAPLTGDGCEQIVR